MPKKARTQRLIAALALLGSIMLLHGATVSNLSAEPSAPHVRAVRAVTPPLLDGKLDEPCWQQATAVNDFRVYEAGVPSVLRTEGRVCFDDKAVYIGMTCFLPQGAQPRGSLKPHDSYIFQDDLVEIMIDPGRSRTDYVQLCINAYGTTYDGTRTRGGAEHDPEWNGDWSAKTYRAEGYYSVEVALPHYNVALRPGIRGAWGLNLCRDSAQPSELSSIAIGGAFNDASRFAILDGIDVNLDRFCFSVGLPYFTRLETDGQTTQGILGVCLKNLTGVAREVKIHVSVVGAPEMPAQHAQTARLEQGAEVQVPLGGLEMPPLYRSRSDLCIVRAKPTQIVVKDAQTEEVLSVFYPQSPALCSELIRVVVDDPWQATPRAGKGVPLQFTIHLQPLLRDEDLRQSKLVVTLTSRATGTRVLASTLVNPKLKNDLRFDTRPLPWDAYDIHATLTNAAGKEITATTALATVLPDGKYRIKVLNNLASELMDAKQRGLLRARQISFMNPRDGWCFFRVSGATSVTLGKDPLLQAKRGAGPVEAMRLLPAGKHTLIIEGAPDSLIVRSIPALLYNVHETGTQIKPFGIHTWERLGKSILPNCNMIEGAQKPYPEEMAEWRAAGKLWIANYGIPRFEGGQPPTAEVALQHWRNSLGYTDPRFDGMQIDEYGPSTFPADGFVAIAESLALLSEDPNYRGKLHIPFACGLHRTEACRLFMKAVMRAGWPFSEEWYIGECASEQEARQTMHRRLVEAAKGWERDLPGSVRKMIVTLMYSYLPYCTTNVRPDIDFRVHLDMQMETLANDPVFFGLFGVQPYRSNYVNTEILDWMGKLLRHYCIEGKRERFSKDPYQLRHILNPDFDEGTKHWEIQPAALGSVTVGNLPRYGSLQGRYGGTWSEGNNFLLTRRCENAPNVFSQEIRNLTPGRLYSFKMITGDHQDLLQGKSRSVLHPVCVTIDGADTLPGEENSFETTFAGISASRSPAPFNSPSGPRYYMNYHWRVFRARSTTATLRVSDWESDKELGGPIGQELMYNFIEVQPYGAG